MADYKKMLKNVPADIKHRVDRFTNIAYVKYVTGCSIEAYSPLFKDISINAPGGTKGCQRGDTILIKLSARGTNHFELIENITLNQETKQFENDLLCFDWTEPERIVFKKWRDEYLKSKQR